jgi:hypothetical protein
MFHEVFNFNGLKNAQTAIPAALRPLAPKFSS